MDRSKVIAYLRHLSPKAFAELFYEVAKGVQLCPEERSHREVHQILAYACRDLEDGEPVGDWNVTLICPVPDQDWIDDAPICQHSHHCGHDTLSWAKNSICPVCSGEVYGT